MIHAIFVHVQRMGILFGILGFATEDGTRLLSGAAQLKANH